MLTAFMLFQTFQVYKIFVHAVEEHLSQTYGLFGLFSAVRW